MDENIIIQPINGDGYIIELTEFSSLNIDPQTLEIESLINDLSIELFLGVNGGRISLAGHVSGQEQAGTVHTLLQKEAITDQENEDLELLDQILFYDYSLGKLSKTNLTGLKSLIDDDTFVDSIDDNGDGTFDFNLNDGTYLTLDLSGYFGAPSVKSFTGAQLINRQITVSNYLGIEAPNIVIYKDGVRLSDTGYEAEATSSDITFTVNTIYNAGTIFKYRLL